MDEKNGNGTPGRGARGEGSRTIHMIDPHDAKAIVEGPVFGMETHADVHTKVRPRAEADQGGHVPRGARRVVQEARPASHGQEPGHVRRRGGQRRLHGVHRRRAAARSARLDVQHRGRDLAVVHGAVRELRRGAGRGSRQGAGGHAAQDEDRHDGQRAPRRTGASSRSPRPSCARATSSSSPRARSSRATATSSRASPPSTSRPSRASPLRSSARAAATVPRSPAAPACSPTRSSCCVTSDPGRDVPGQDDLARGGRRAAEDAERDRAHDPAGRAHDHLPHGHGHPAAVRASTAGRRLPVVVLIALLVCLIPTTIGGLLSAIGIAGHGPPRAPQRARHVGPRRRSGRRRGHAAPRQDRDHHVRQPPGRGVPAGGRRGGEGAGRLRAARVALRRDARGPLHRRARQGLRLPRARPGGRGRRVRAVHRPDAHERRGRVRRAHPQGRLRRGHRLGEAAGRRDPRRSRGPRGQRLRTGRHAARGRRATRGSSA